MGKVRGLLVALFVLFMVSAAAGTVSAQRWNSLGSTELTNDPESDRITVRSFEGQIRQVRFGVEERPVRFYAMRITYRSGEQQYFMMNNQVVQPGGFTKAYSVRGNDRFITRIHFFAEALSPLSGRPAKVTAYGLR